MVYVMGLRGGGEVRKRGGRRRRRGGEEEAREEERRRLETYTACLQKPLYILALSFFLLLPACL